jgi:poly(3-hydroxybutyrate) depolymerase
MMKIAIFAAAVLFAAVMAAPVPEDGVVPESTKVDTVAPLAPFAPPELLTQQSSEPAPCTEELMHSEGASGSLFTCSGPGPRDGHYITYDITVPSHCTSSSKCGVILNIHGQGMNKDSMEYHTGVSAAALAGKKYIVIAPSDFDSTWEFAAFGQHNDAALIHDFLEMALEVYEDIVDTDRVHSTGFSAGAINSFQLLCENSDKICSVAGIGFNPLGEFLYWNSPGTPYYAGMQTCFNPHLGGTGPDHKRSMMVQQGTVDPYFVGQASNALANTVTAVKGIYGMSGDGEKLSKGDGVDWTRYTGGGVTFEAVSYTFSNGDGTLNGHCLPKEGLQDSSAVHYPASVFCGSDADGHVSAYTWGEEAIKFFEAHPCNEGGPPPPPTRDCSGACTMANNRCGSECPADMPHRYPWNNRCFHSVWGGPACNVDPQNDPLHWQRGDTKCVCQD